MALDKIPDVDDVGILMVFDRYFGGRTVWLERMGLWGMVCPERMLVAGSDRQDVLFN